jgi:chemotaxis protein methyltransferase CheR
MAPAIREVGSQFRSGGKSSSLYLSKTLFIEFRRFLLRQTGRHLTDAHRYHLGVDIKHRVRAVGLADAASYLEFINSDTAECRYEIAALIDQTTHQVTEFFRHPDQFETFRKIVRKVVALRRQTTFPTLKLWSVACATGEEPYTMAMVVRELGCITEDWDVSVKATDVCRAAVDRGRKGVYGASSLKAVPEPYRSKYFQAERDGSDQVVITSDIRQMVEFGVLNLIEEDQVNLVRKMDVIFCRNVLLYFDMETKKSVVNSLWRCLWPGGYLVLGPCDGVRGLGEIFQRTLRSGRILRRLDAESWLFPTQGG